jgi:hypothetical protein
MEGWGTGGRKGELSTEREVQIVRRMPIQTWLGVKVGGGRGGRG